MYNNNNETNNNFTKSFYVNYAKLRSTLWNTSFFKSNSNFE